MKKYCADTRLCHQTASGVTHYCPACMFYWLEALTVASFLTGDMLSTQNARSVVEELVI